MQELSGGREIDFDFDGNEARRFCCQRLIGRFEKCQYHSLEAEEFPGGSYVQI